MKSKLCIGISLLMFVLLLVFVACNKAVHEDSESGDAANANTLASLNNPNGKCSYAPDYGDSVVFLQPKNVGDYTIQPKNNSSAQGTYVAWPEGLDIDAATGVINISNSETGVRYNIGFVKQGSQDTCISQLIVGGISYIDSIYVLSKNDTLAAPVFNANPLAAPVCDASNDDDYPDNNHNGNNKCSFDDEVQGSKANDQKLRIRTTSGVINLKKSYEDGLFGKNAKNGESKKIKIVYKLNDKSNKTKQKVTVQVYYYDKVSNIPASLYNEVTSKRKSLLNYRIINGKPRPPYLIIAGLAQ